MFKRLLKFGGFLSLTLIIFVQSEELFISFFVFFPALLLPALYFLEEENKKWCWAALGVMTALFIFYCVRHPRLEMFALGGLQISVFLAFLFYRGLGERETRLEMRQAKNALDQLEVLQSKHQSRLDSLHHLEKQVAGLLDLFEIARDFNDCLSLQGIASILYERVRPELPFHQMLLVLADAKDPLRYSQIILINERGVQDSLPLDALSPLEQKSVETVRGSKKMLQNQDHLTFPIIIDGDIKAYLLIDKIQSDDLAKFEVLAAYLGLHIKKVHLYEAVRELSIHDGLTGVFVRRHFVERFDEELKRSIKYELPLAVLMLDIDHFKRYNDTYGHLAGDATLKQVAALLRENLRRVDIVGRYGGEEFVIVLPETRKAEALEVAERIRSNIARHNFKVYNDQTRVTVSIGLSFFPDSLQKFSEAESVAAAQALVQCADKALYRAKDDGRNRVISYQDL